MDPIRGARICIVLLRSGAKRWLLSTQFPPAAEGMLNPLASALPMDPARSDLGTGCLYSNRSERMVILRCVGPDAFFHEKVIFPFEDWSFACPPDADVQIWSHGVGGAELLEAFPASELGIDGLGSSAS